MDKQQGIPAAVPRLFIRDDISHIIMANYYAKTSDKFSPSDVLEAFFNNKSEGHFIRAILLQMIEDRQLMVVIKMVSVELASTITKMSGELKLSHNSAGCVESIQSENSCKLREFAPREAEICMVATIWRFTEIVKSCPRCPRLVPDPAEFIENHGPGTCCKECQMPQKIFEHIRQIVLTEPLGQFV